MARRTTKQILRAIRLAGADGLSERQMMRGNLFQGIPKRERVDALETLQLAELVACVDMPTGGRPKKVWVALDEDEAGESDVTDVECQKSEPA
jgi:hypothetical protein